MKKMFVAFGIAIALICGVFAIVFQNAQIAEAEVTEPVTVEEAVTNYVAKHHPEYSTIEDVDVRRVEADDAFGGWRVDAFYTADGELNAISINASVMDTFVF